eukprot:scaffold13.g420.t1
MPTLQNFVRGAQALKLKEVPAYAQKWAGEHYQPAKVQQRWSAWLQNYKTQYIDTGSAKPLFDLCIYGFVFSYALSWPRKYAHYKHEQEAKLKGGHH